MKKTWQPVIGNLLRPISLPPHNNISFNMFIQTAFYGLDKIVESMSVIMKYVSHKALFKKIGSLTLHEWCFFKK